MTIPPTIHRVRLGLWTAYQPIAGEMTPNDDGTVSVPISGVGAFGYSKRNALRKLAEAVQDAAA